MKPSHWMIALVAVAATACSSSGANAPQTALPAARPAAATGGNITLVNAAARGPVVSADTFGASLETWYQFWEPWVAPSLAASGMHLVRFPGGSESDLYHWEHGGSLCVQKDGYIFPGADYDRLIHTVQQPLKLDISITLNYGSNRSCNGGGDPTEAAAWVAYAKAKGYVTHYWTVGNENYGSWEYDLHPHKHDPYTYSQAVRTGYYPDVKAADPTAQLGVVVDTPNDRRWNNVVLRNAAPFDFVELHYYPEYVHDNDAFLLGPAVSHFERDLSGLRAEMTAAGVATSVPIYVGEYNADAGIEGKQSVSIVNGLFLGQMLGTMLDAGVPRATWWLAYGSCDQGGDYSKSLYGWQHFGSEALFSDNIPYPTEGCPTTPHIPGGTPFPTARVMTLFAKSVPAGSQTLGVTEKPSLGTRVRAYAFASGTGYVAIFFNNTLSPIDTTMQLEHASKSSFSAGLTVYGKQQYDLSQQNQWVGPKTQDLGSVSSSLPLTLAPYSMTVLTLR